ncbi:MAG TPA: ATP phosphoribosyltransferase regulatory subunit, partial [Afipia sp.]|nr:ATP phosphoribosyltransferase regulatory subunit [Afipia sp.]
MSQTSAATATGSAARAESLLQTFARAGYTHARPPILQPA